MLVSRRVDGGDGCIDNWVVSGDFFESDKFFDEWLGVVGIF